ncbi:Mrp family chromosome partitioning ATPase [Kribbella sp. VKM Ac-2527]|uniref:Mrp family chromosome partitioning ATPase n=1 Tax=Kribbella caucasensis TaxID=2512215 RepID=A0A4V3CA20_9ACTN|nr:hypothetical protein [Kribbella sp. VKM Ac-2527]TDO48556.1 Mrp family chromosome partitioning ATPase [Kribbella sp. VKM Ac-2527]
MSRFAQRMPGSRGIVLSYLWVIVAVTLLTVVAAGATALTRPAEYRATAQVVVHADTSQNSAAIPDMGTEREVANSGIVAATAAKTLATDVTTATKGLSVTVPVDAKVLVFKYSAPTQVEALRGATAFTRAYVDYRNLRRSTRLAEVISPATVPDKPQQANLALVIGVGLVLGLMLGIGFVFVWDRVRGRLRGAADVERQTGLGVLAHVPAVREQQLPLTPANALPSPSREVFGYLVAHFSTLTTRGKGASVLVTSPSAGAGRTTVAARLAIAMAATGRDVVLIGGDLGLPDVHTLFGLPLIPGLTDVLADSAKQERAVQATAFVDLRVLPSGTPRTSGWFNAEDLELLIQGLSKRAFVVIDGPVAGSADAALLAGRTDHVLLVVDAQRGTRSAAAEAVAALSGVGGNLVGCVTTAPHPRKFLRLRRTTAVRVPPRPAEGLAPDADQVETEHVSK